MRLHLYLAGVVPLAVYGGAVTMRREWLLTICLLVCGLIIGVAASPSKLPAIVL